MAMKRVLPYYVGICAASLFSGIRYEVGPIVLRPFDALIVIGAILTVAAVSKRGYIQKIQDGGLLCLLVSLFLYRTVNGLILSSQSVAIKEGIQFLEFLIFIFILLEAVKGEKSARALIKTFYVVIGLICIGTAIYHIRSGQYSGYKYLLGGAQKYAFGLFSLFSFVYWTYNKAIPRDLVIVIVSVTLLIMSGERKGWLSFATASIAVYLWGNSAYITGKLKRLVEPRLLVLYVVIFASIFVASRYEYSKAQINSLFNTYKLAKNSNLKYAYNRTQDVGRYNGLVFVFKKIQEKPLFGLGTGSIKEYKTQVSADINPGHGSFQSYTVENGLFGLVMYTMVWILCIKKSWNIFPSYKRNNILRYLLIGFVVYSATINLFLAGGAINTLLLTMSVGLLLSFERLKIKSLRSNGYR